MSRKQWVYFESLPVGAHFAICGGVEYIKTAELEAGSADGSRRTFSPNAIVRLIS
jgi:hypothetical protein